MGHEVRMGDGSAVGTKGTKAPRRATALARHEAGRAALRVEPSDAPNRAGATIQGASGMASADAQRLVGTLLAGESPLIDAKEAARTLGLSVKRTREWCREAGVLRLEQGHYVRFSRVSFLAAIAVRLRA